MAVKKLTQLGVDRLSPPTETHAYYWDTLLPGFGVRISPKGKKSWVANCRVRGKLVPTTLASTDLVPSIGDARELARKAMLEARQGINPIEARRQQAAVDKATSEAAAASARADSYTLAVLASQFSDYAAAKHRPSTARETRRLLGRVVALSNLGDRPAAQITEADITLYANAIKPGAAGELERSNQVLTLARAFKWAMKTGKLPKIDNPAAVDVPARGQSRDRVLTDEEIVAFWRGTERLGWPFGPAFRLMLITGQRRGECCGMRWDELDLDNCRWVIPASRAKNAKASIVHLHKLAVDILQALPRLHGCPFVFSTTGTGPVSGFGWAKVRLAQHMGMGDDWTLHDCRRTVATNLQKLHVRLEVTEAVLNHKSGSRSGIVGVYQVHDWAPEKVEALTKWGDFLARLVGENVVALRSA